jgi:hypothetical protein
MYGVTLAQKLNCSPGEPVGGKRNANCQENTGQQHVTALKRAIC